MSTVATLHETEVDQTKRLPPETGRGVGFSPTRLFADNAFAARMWFLVACAAVGFCFLQPYLIIGAYRVKERVVVLDGGGTFSISPLLGFGGEGDARIDGAVGDDGAFPAQPARVRLPGHAAKDLPRGCGGQSAGRPREGTLGV